jgi:hypothetical protein
MNPSFIFAYILIKYKILVYYKMSDKELFEENVKVEVKEEKQREETPTPTPESEPDLPEPEEVIEKPKKEKKPRKKRVLTDAQKEQLKANLAKGRATSLANRKKKKKLKDIAKEEKTIEEDTKIFENLKKKLTSKQIAEENDKLKSELAELKATMSKPKKAERVPTPVPHTENKKVEAPPPPMPVIPEKKVLSGKQKRMMLRGL